MSMRANGGIYGPQNRSTPVLSSGVWRLYEQQQSIGARTWYGIPPTVPNSPNITGLTINSANSVSVAFSTNGYDGGSTITGYTITVYPGGATFTGSTSPIVCTGLSANIKYTFYVYATNAAGNSALNSSKSIYTASTINYLVVAGGAGGGYFSGGGGGAGGAQNSNFTPLTGTVLSVTVGSGGSGSGQTGNNLSAGAVGSNSVISGAGISTVTSVGGGGGASLANASTTGGSGGGGSPLYAASSGTGGQGNSGGSGGNISSGYYIGGGGGGSNAAGSSATTTPGAGGTGLTSTITGSSVTYAGGGGGAGTSFIPLGGTNLNGSSSYLTITNNLSNYQFGTGDFTIECWVNKSSNGVNGYDGLVELSNGSIGALDGYYLEVSSSRGIYFTIAGTSVTYGTWTNDGLWHHIAVVRNSGTVTIYKDGTNVASGTIATSIPTTASTFWIGNDYNGVTNYLFNGSISNLRILKGTALYTSNFTPPTSPLTAITNCTLLTCLTGGFYDASSVGATINQNGSPTLTYSSPFSPQASTISGASGGSGGGGTGGGYNGNATAGTVNTGGGGGGGGYLNNTAAAGGSGVVVLSLPTAAYTGVYTGTPTITTSGANTILKFLGNGSYTV